MAAEFFGGLAMGLSFGIFLGFGLLKILDRWNEKRTREKEFKETEKVYRKAHWS